MAMSQTSILTTRDTALEPRRIGQVIAVPTGRLDKVSVYLEPIFSSSPPIGTLTIEAYDVTLGGLPTGSALASDSKDFSEVFGNSFFNFRLECTCPTRVAIVLSTSGASTDYIGWRYGLSGAAFYPALLSTDGGASWTSSSSRRFAFLAYSHLANATDAYDQSSSVLPGGTTVVLDNTQAEWQQGILNNVDALVDNTVVLTIGNLAITFVVDQSGSMGWNDPSGTRFDFAKALIDDIEATLPTGDSATYSLVTFSSMPIDDLLIYQTGQNPMPYSVRIVRRAGTPPLGPADGTTMYEGYARSYEDSNVAAGTTYHYAAYTVDEAGLFSDPRRDRCSVAITYKQPYGVSAFLAEEEVVYTGGYDLGKRQVNLSWSNPDGYDYDTVIIVRRTDRYPESQDDGTIVATLTPASTTTSYTDDMLGTQLFVNGLGYYYSIFTVAATLVKCSSLGKRTAIVPITMADRSWDMNDPPTPPPGFDVTPPAAPVLSEARAGNESALLSWTGDADSKRYKVYFREDRYPTILSDGGYDGTLLHDAEVATYSHYVLENLQPYFYVVVAYDLVGNQSDPMQASVTPTSTPVVGVPPPPPGTFRIDLVSSTKAVVSFSNPSTRLSPVSGYYGIPLRFKALAIPRDSSYVPENTFLDVVQVNSSSTVAWVNHNIVLNSLSATAGTAATTSISAQKATPSTTLSMKPSFYTKNSSGGKLIEITALPVDVSMKLPFALTITNEPPQLITRRTWNGVVTNSDGTKTKTGYVTQSLPGILTNSGIPLRFVVDATFAGFPLVGESLVVLATVIDKTTNTQSGVIQFPGANPDGTLSVILSETNYEILDRTGQPTGRFEERQIGTIQIPPQTVPGDYTLQVQGIYRGFDITSTFDFYVEPSLNVDLTLSPFMPDGSSFSEQFAYVYVGAFDGTTKTPVSDGLVIDWSIACVSGCPVDGQARPFYGPSGASSIKSQTSGGIARQIFFGPGLDVVPATGVDANVTSGELYQVRVVVQYQGMTRVAYDFVELVPIQQAFDTYNRIFSRKANGFNWDVIYADGTAESVWEVLANPAADVGWFSSGKHFYSKVTGLGGIVPSLSDGTIITMIVEPLFGESPNPVLVKTDLSPSGRLGSARATVSSGKATFTLSLNQKVSGPAERASTSTPRNIAYGADQIFKPSVPLLYSIRTLVSVESSGKPVVYSGGGSDLKYSIPPCFIGFKEPLTG